MFNYANYVIISWKHYRLLVLFVFIEKVYETGFENAHLCYTSASQMDLDEQRPIRTNMYFCMSRLIGCPFQRLL